MRSAVLTASVLLCVLGGSRAFATSFVGEAAPTGYGYRDASGTIDTRNHGPLSVSIRTSALKPERGYTPIDVVLHNTGLVPLQVRLTFQGHSNSGQRTSERTVEVPPQRRLVTWLPVPATAQAGSILVESPGLSPLTLPAHTPIYVERSTGGTVLVLGTLKAFDDTSGVPRVEATGSPLFSVRTVDPRDAPRELSSYVGYSVVMVPGDLASVPADVWAVLESYVLSGGRLVLPQVSSSLTEHLPLFTAEGSRDAVPYGFGRVRLCGAALECGQVLNAMLGEVIPGVVNPAGAAPRWERSNLLAGGITPLLDHANTPVGRFLLLIFAFVLAVGPGGLMLARRRGPVAVLVAVPLVSVLTCVALVTWSVLVDGFAVHSARYSLTWLDAERSRVVTLGVSAWYANVSSGPVRFPATSALLAPDNTDEMLADLDWTNGLTVTHGFLPPRTYREWGEVAVLPSRARLVVRREGGTVRVQNALGARLVQGYVRVGNQSYALPALEDGAEGTLGEPLPASATPVSQLLSSVGGPSLAEGRLSGGEVNFRAPLPEGGFIARLGGLGSTPSSAVEVELEAGIHLMRGQSEGGRP
ncbi:hypothetical protein [Myxococcus xanthus]|uniref:hypothetical protein n=1 Tax=Myxococcus xanthus TaxID=34 RepID=UPI00112D855E|nr:hypothetical protein [Myxococcus xanthus]QDF00155.1 hypothetical protein BHS05_32385 [Myxococcus xanthus]QDF07920.1 hypothetical protein BHS04_32660 [Myxococcus xanthus]